MNGNEKKELDEQKDKDAEQKFLDKTLTLVPNHARARLWSLMSKYGWSLWGSIRIGTTGDAEIRDWAQALWGRAMAEFDSPEFEALLARAARPDSTA